jgi:ribosomal protein S18
MVADRLITGQRHQKQIQIETTVRVVRAVASAL